MDIYFPEQSITTYRRRPVPATKLVLANDNEYVPVLCIKRGERFTGPKGDDFMYNMTFANDISGVIGRTKTRMTDFCKTPSDYLSSTSWCSAGHVSLPVGQYYASFGTIYSIDPLCRSVNYEGIQRVIPIKILMCLAVKTKYLFNITGEPVNTNTGYFSLVIDKAFINDPVNFRLYRNVKRYYIDIMVDKVDVVYTSNINKVCFNGNLTPPTFDTFEQSLEYSAEVSTGVFDQLIKQGEDVRL